MTTLQCAVVGSPIAHSLSPAMHRAAYAELGLDWSYTAHDLTEAEFPAFLAGLDDSWRGLSVTAPLKRGLAAALDDVSDDVEFLGVANTLVLGERRMGFNTDVPGAVAALREAGVNQVRTARIFGAGATAASMTLALSRLGLDHLEVAVRDQARAGVVIDVAARCGVRVLTTPIDQPGDLTVDVVVSTVPVAAVDPRWSRSARCVFDVVYDPWPTPLAQSALDAGTTVVNGLDLLAHQAALQVHLMTGSTVRPTTLREAALAELARR